MKRKFSEIGKYESDTNSEELEYFHSKPLSELDEYIDNLQTRLGRLKYIKHYHTEIRQARVDKFIESLRDRRFYGQGQHKVNQDELNDFLEQYPIYDAYTYESAYDEPPNKFRYLKHHVVLYKQDNKLHKFVAKSKFSFEGGCYRRKWIDYDDNYPKLFIEIIKYGKFPDKQYTGNWYEIKDDLENGQAKPSDKK